MGRFLAGAALTPRLGGLGVCSRRQLLAVKVANVPRPDSICMSQPRRVISGHTMAGELREDSAYNTCEPDGWIW